MAFRTKNLLVGDLVLLAPIVALPWFFGGVSIWAERGASFLLVVGAAWVLWHEGWTGIGLRGKGTRWLLPALLLAALGAAQLVPLPAAMQRVLNPKVAAAWDDITRAAESPAEDPLRAFERVATARAVEETGPEDVPVFPIDSGRRCLSNSYPTSVYPAFTADALAWYIALFAAFLAVRCRSRFAPVRRIYTLSILTSLIGVAAVTLAQQWTGGFFRSLRPWLGSEFLWGPYVNRNHLCGAMELAVPALLGFGWSLVDRARSRDKEGLGLGLAVVGGGLLCFFAATVAASKTTAVILPASVAALLLLGSRGRRQRQLALILVVVFLLAAIGVMMLTDVGVRMQSHLDQSGEGVSAVGRSGAWLATLSMVRDYPIVGVGFGAFSEVYPAYSPPGVSKRWSAAHNDYLQVTAEGGLVALALVLWLAFGYAAQVAPSLFPGKSFSRERLGIALGVLGLSIHAVADFNHQIPANALLFVALAALALPELQASKVDHRPQRKILLPLILFAVVLYGARGLEGWLAGAAYHKGGVSERNQSYLRAQTLYPIGAVGSRTAGALRAAAEAHLDTFDGARKLGLPLDDSDRRDLELAARYYVLLYCSSPASARSFEGLARVYERIHDAEEVSGVSVLSGAAMRVAEGLYRLAIERAPNWYVPYDRLAMMKWRYGESEGALEVVRDSAAVLPMFHSHQYKRMDEVPTELQETFADAAWQAMQDDPRLRATRFLIGLAEQDRLLKRHESALKILDMIGESRADARQRAHAEHIRGRTLFAMGRYDEARKSFEFAREDEVFKPFALMELARVAEAQGRHEDALEIRSALRWSAPELPGPSLDYAASLLEAGNLEPALATVRLVVSNHPSVERARTMLVDLLLQLGRLDEAEAEIEALEARGMTRMTPTFRSRLYRERGFADEE